jgi:putative flippase GtrA
LGAVALQRPLRFAAVGVLNTAVGLAIIYGLKYWLAWPDVHANIAGYACGLAISFVLNRRWTFAHDGDALGALLRFVVCFAVAYSANLALVLWLIRHGVDAYLAHAIGIVIYTSLMYFGSLCFVFARGRS